MSIWKSYVICCSQTFEYSHVNSCQPVFLSRCFAFSSSSRRNRYSHSHNEPTSIGKTDTNILLNSMIVWYTEYIHIMSFLIWFESPIFWLNFRTLIPYSSLFLPCIYFLHRRDGFAFVFVSCHTVFLSLVIFLWFVIFFLFYLAFYVNVGVVICWYTVFIILQPFYNLVAL